MYIKAWNVGKIVLPMVGKDILLHNFCHYYYMPIFSVYIWSQH